VTFQATGDLQQWTVPAGVVEATFDLYGGQGGLLTGSNLMGGLGGRATATLAVTPGEVVTIAVGQGGGARFGPAPFGGGGLGRDSGNGGGASDIRIGGTDLASRVVVAGGGGGSGDCVQTQPGGAGGGLTGASGVVASCYPGSADDIAGGGGTQDAGGSADSPELEGSFGQGGSGPPQDPSLDDSGGGGGGWYGGGAGAFGGAGGGGSGHGPAGTVFETGVRAGDGLVTVTYTSPWVLSVTTAGTGAGSVQSSPAGIACSSAAPTASGCQAGYLASTLVTLTATPSGGDSFAGWSGDCSGTGACQVTMDQARAVTASFTAAVVPDTVPPNTTLTKAPKKRVHKRLTRFRFSSDETGSRFECSIDGAAFAACTSPVEKRFKPGRHTFAVRAVDAAGNVDATPARVRWRFVPRH
jgi:hypothetical protein